MMEMNESLSYADVVKRRPHHMRAVVKCRQATSWFEQMEESEKDLLSRSNSMSTISSSDDIQSNGTRVSNSLSLDSGQISDMSTDNETCSKKNVIVVDIENELRKRMVEMNLHRSESVDSCRTSTSTCCSDQNCTSDHSRLQLMCQRWQKFNRIETDEGVLSRRQKQINYGKSTIGYKMYQSQVPIEQRTKDHPKTPDIHRKYSRRGFDGLIKIWRKQLHKFDPDVDSTDNQTQNESSDQQHSLDVSNNRVNISNENKQSSDKA